VLHWALHLLGPALGFKLFKYMLLRPEPTAYAREEVGLKTLLQLDKLPKFYYLREEINCFPILLLVYLST